MASCFHVKGKEEVTFNKKNVTIACDVVNGKVTYVDVSSELMGLLFAGDEIININGESTIKTTADFNKAIQSKCPGKVTIEFMRDDHCLVVEKPLPPRRPNSEMFEVTMTYRGGAATGIIIHRMSSDARTVTISVVQSPSTVCKHIKNGDILVKVNDIYVQDRDAARKLLYASVNNTKKVTITIERSTTTDPLGPAPPPPTGVKATPVSEQFKALAASKSASIMAPPPKPPAGKINKQFDVMLPADVIEIMKANKDFYKKACTNPPCIVKIEKAEKDAPPPAPISMAETPTSETVKFPFDPSPKPLKATPKRTGS